MAPNLANWRNLIRQEVRGLNCRWYLSRVCPTQTSYNAAEYRTAGCHFHSRPVHSRNRLALYGAELVKVTTVVLNYLIGSIFNHALTAPSWTNTRSTFSSQPRVKRIPTLRKGLFRTSCVDMTHVESWSECVPDLSVVADFVSRHTVG